MPTIKIPIVKDAVMELEVPTYRTDGKGRFVAIFSADKAIVIHQSVRYNTIAQHPIEMLYDGDKVAGMHELTAWEFEHIMDLVKSAITC